MALYHFTFHAYRSWNADRTHVRRDQRGIQSPHPRLAQYRQSIAADPPVHFSAVQQLLLKLAAQEACRTLSWRLHATAVTPTHVHVVLDPGDANVKAAAARMKRVMGYKLTKATGTTGHRWFSRGSDIKHVTSAVHREHLLTRYLPDHVNQGGQFWDLREK